MHFTESHHILLKVACFRSWLLMTEMNHPPVPRETWTPGDLVSLASFRDQTKKNADGALSPTPVLLPLRERQPERFGMLCSVECMLSGVNADERLLAPLRCDRLAL